MEYFKSEYPIENVVINRNKNHCSCSELLIDEMIEIIKTGGFTSLGFLRGNWPDLSFLLDLNQDIVHLSCQPENIDWDTIMQLTTLRSLTINGAVKQKINFNDLPNLKKLEYYWHKNNANSLFLHEGIEELDFYNLRVNDMSSFENMKSLKSLGIIRGTMASLDGLDKIHSLKLLSLSCVSKLENVSALNHENQLLYLAFYSCNKINFLKEMCGLKKLLYFGLCRQKNIESLNFVKSFPSIEMLGIFEMSVKNGDLMFLNELPYLKSLRMDKKRFYNVDVDVFTDELKAKYGNFDLNFRQMLQLENAN